MKRESVAQPQSRGADRRRREVALRYPDRRRGFDRRRPSPGTLRRAYHDMLDEYRDRAEAVAAVLFVLVLLNITDMLLTSRALSMGAEELNPVMAWALGHDPALAAAIKIAMGAGAALVMWLLRRYRRVLELTLLLLAGFTALLVYQFVGLTALAT